MSSPQYLCPRCGSTTRRHCPNPICHWRVCNNDACRTYGVDEARWTRPPPTKETRR